MCDGVTQGQDGMELSLLSREVIAMSAAVGLSHNMFDGALYLGVCDKIVRAGDGSAVVWSSACDFVPSGPMASGLPNKEKCVSASCMRKAKPIVRRCWKPKPPPTMRRAPVRSTARPTPTRWWWSLWGCSFRARPLSSRTRRCAALTEAAARQVTRLTGNGNEWMSMGKMVDEKVIVNGIVALLATGGSTNHTMHGGHGARGGYPD